jgi:GNAT superfamily N-acetyltransferase
MFNFEFGILPLMVPDLTIENVSFLTPGETEDLFNLWNNEYPVMLKYDNVIQLELYMDELAQPYHLLLYNLDRKVLGWAFSFNRSGERWFAMLLDQSIQGKGYGRALINKLKEHVPILNGWVVDHDEYTKSNGKPYLSPLGFYKKCGFDVLPDQRLELDILSAVKIRRIH